MKKRNRKERRLPPMDFTNPGTGKVSTRSGVQITEKQLVNLLDDIVREIAIDHLTERRARSVMGCLIETVNPRTLSEAAFEESEGDFWEVMIEEGFPIHRHAVIDIIDNVVTDRKWDKAIEAIGEEVPE